MTLKDHSDYIGRIEPSSRSMCPIDCTVCEEAIPDEAPAFVYFDLTINDFYLLCEKCNQS